LILDKCCKIPVIVVMNVMFECYILLKWVRIAMIREPNSDQTMGERLLELLRLILSWGHLSFQDLIV
jgi:hypothetical protein